MAVEPFQIQLAPLQGYTDCVYRNALHRWFGGVDCFYTPFVRLEHGTVPNRCRRDVDPARNCVPRLVPQLIAASYEEAKILLDMLCAHGYKEVDINLGCPFPMLVKRRKGCGLLPYPDEVARLLRLVEERTDISFSLKMRLGLETPEEGMALLPLLNRVPLRQITLHARVGRQQYKGACQLEAFSRFAAAYRHPLLYNGDVTAAEDVARVSALVPGLAGVMVGRGLLSRPWLAAECKTGAPPEAEHRRALLRGFHAELLDGYERQLEGGEAQLVAKMKTLWDYLLPDADRKALKRIQKAQRLSAYLEAVRDILL